MKITSKETFEVGAYAVNCTLLVIDGKAWIVDPGSEATLVRAHLRRLGVTPAGILLTHAHFDHIGAVNDLQRAYPGLPVFVGANDVPVLTHPFNQMAPDYPAITRPDPLVALTGSDADGILPGLPDVRVIETPGHTPGGVCYFFPGDGNEPGLLLSGDTLFAGSVGRTDFPGGDMATLLRSLKKLTALPAETVVIPGHGPFTTVGRECDGNPFLQ